MFLALVVFLLVAGLVVGGYFAATQLPGILEARRLDRRLREVTTDAPAPVADGSTDSMIVRRPAEGPLPLLDRFISNAAAGSWLSRLIEQSGVPTTPSAVFTMALVCAGILGLVALVFTHLLIAAVAAALVGSIAPFLWLRHKRTKRLRTFEEQFPEALDLLSRAIRAGHAFQTALGMAADEMPAPVGPEFKKTFDQQNFGLPLKEALNQLSERVAILDVRFFVTAVLIQRETGGNLSEILDNLAHVVRERFKIMRQVRVHTAHGRFTGYVLLALPAGLAVVLSILNHEHMAPLFQDRIGLYMIGGGIVLQFIGYLWIKKVISIEV